MAQNNKQQEEQIMKEMIPYLLHVLWPIMIIAIIAFKYGPS